MKSILLILLMAPVLAQAQLARDSVLVNERSIDRPVIVHDRQLRITGGYDFSTLSSRFDETGDKIKLSSEGRANILHHTFIDLRYGFFELLQLNVAFNYKSNVQREQPIIIFAAPEPAIQVNEENRLTGMEDIFVGVDFLVPLKTRKIDLALSLGVSAPTAKSETVQPSHAFEDLGDTQVISYNNNLNRGVGVVMTFLGAQFKYRLKDFAFTTFFRYGFPTAETENFEWRFRLVNDEFEYRSRIFNLAPANTYFGLVEIEYQLFPWIDLFLDIEQTGTSGGWSDETGQKVAFRDERLTFINPGIEILLTSRFWLRQKVVFAIEGENAMTPFSVQTALIYNLFPF